jgi:hypothetical protein
MTRYACAVLAFFVACVDSASSPADDASTRLPRVDASRCDNISTCHRGLWPRLIIGLIPMAPTKERLEDAFSVQVRSAGQRDFRDIRKRMCPEGGGSIVCSYGYFPGAMERDLEVLITGPDGVDQVATVSLMEHNYCGRDIAYLPVVVDSDGQLTIGTLRYVSPCD